MSDHEAHIAPSDPAPRIVKNESITQPTTPLESDSQASSPTIVRALLLWVLVTAIALPTSGVIQEAIIDDVDADRIFGLAMTVPLFTLVTCAALYLAFSRYSLLLRFGAGLATVALAIVFLKLVTYMVGGQNFVSEPFAQPFVAISVGVMSAGAVLSIARFAGWNVRRSTSPVAVGSQFSIVQILQLTMICAIGFAATKGVSLRTDDWAIVGVIVALIVGQALTLPFLMIDRWSIAARAFSTIVNGLLIFVLLILFVGIINKGIRLNNEALFLYETFLFTFNFLAMICYVLRARGYRLKR